MRKVQLLEGEYYHIFNRGVDKRVIFKDDSDFRRFLLSVVEFNSIEPIGSIYEHAYKGKTKFGNPVSKKKKEQKKEYLVEIVAFCLNKNHFHLLLKQCADKGIEKFMHRLGLGFTKYFNERHDRNGILFQGPFKAVHIESNEQLIHLSAYINLNNVVHGYGNNDFRSSWGEYIGKDNTHICRTEIVLGQFSNVSEYQKLAKKTVANIKERRELEKLTLE